ncbi:hypothetical protein [Pseudoalteromonas sp. BDTF-M6]
MMYEEVVDECRCGALFYTRIDIRRGAWALGDILFNWIDPARRALPHCP